MWENRNCWANRYLGRGALGSIRIGSAENWMREQVNSHDSMLILRDMKLVSIAYGELLLCQSEPRYIPTRSKTQSWMVCVQLSKRERVKVQHNIIFWCIQIPSKPNLWYQFKPFILSAENFMCHCMDYITSWYERIPYSNGLTHGINLLNFYPYLSNLTVKLFHVFLIQLSKYEICKKE